MQYKTVRPKTLDDDDMAAARAFAIRWVEFNDDEAEDTPGVDVQRGLVMQKEKAEDEVQQFDVARPAGA